MKYLGYELKMDSGRYVAHAPDGVRIGSGSKEEMRSWIREHRAAGQGETAEQPMSRESARALIQDTQRWQTAYEKARDEVERLLVRVRELADEREAALASRDKWMEKAQAMGEGRLPAERRVQEAERALREIAKDGGGSKWARDTARAALAEVEA